MEKDGAGQPAPFSNLFYTKCGEIMKKRKFLRKEGGQSLVEFALVLPLFMLILMGILDFGWLFYNYIGVENCARNGARIACVEYSTTNYDSQSKTPIYPQRFNPNLTDSNGFYQSLDKTGDYKYCNTEENDIVKAVVLSKPKSVTLTNIELSYSFDGNNRSEFEFAEAGGIERRSTGDVTVKVEGTMHVLTPVLGVFSDHMQFKLTSQSTYKVEKMADSSSTP